MCPHLGHWQYLLQSHPLSSPGPHTSGHPTLHARRPWIPLSREMLTLKADIRAPVGKGTLLTDPSSSAITSRQLSCSFHLTEPVTIPLPQQ